MILFCPDSLLGIRALPGGGEGQQLGTEGTDLTLDRGRIQGFVLPSQPGFRSPDIRAGVGQYALERGGGCVVFPDASPADGPGSAYR